MRRKLNCGRSGKRKKKKDGEKRKYKDRKNIGRVRMRNNTRGGKERRRKCK